MALKFDGAIKYFDKSFQTANQNLENLTKTVEYNKKATDGTLGQTKQDISTKFEETYINFKNELSDGLEKLRSSIEKASQEQTRSAGEREGDLQKKIVEWTAKLGILTQDVALFKNILAQGLGAIETKVAQKVESTLKTVVPQTIKNDEIAQKVSAAVKSTVSQELQTAVSANFKALSDQMETMSRSVSAALEEIGNVKEKLETEIVPRTEKAQRKNRENTVYLLSTLIFAMVSGLNIFLLIMGQPAMLTDLRQLYLAAFSFVAISVASVILFGFVKAMDVSPEEKKHYGYYIITALLSATAFVLAMVACWA